MKGSETSRISSNIMQKMEMVCVLENGGRKRWLNLNLFAFD